MKVAPSYVSKSKLMKKIEERAAERAKKVVISDKIDTIDKAIIEAQRDNLARYADRHQCTIRFVPDGENGGNTVMKVYKDKYVLYRPHDPFNDFGTSYRMAVPLVENIYQGTAAIPSTRVLTTDRNFANQVKESVKNILDSNKGLDVKV